MLNVVAVQGRLVADPDIRVTTTGKKVASIRLACDRGRKDQDGTSLVDWLNVILWERRAGFAEQYLRKGMMIAVSGRLQSRQYQDRNGNNRQAVEIVANDVSFCEPKRSAPVVDEGGYAPPAGYAPAEQSPAGAPAGGMGADDFALIEDEGDLPF